MPDFSLPLARAAALCLPRRLVAIERTTFCATVPRSMASASKLDSDVVTFLAMAGDRPSAVRRSCHALTIATVNAESFTAPRIGRIWNFKCDMYCSRVVRSSVAQL